MKVIGKRAGAYVAYPTRIHKQDEQIPEQLKEQRTIERIERFLVKRGFAPLDPFGSGKFKYFEGGRIGREGTLDWTCHMQRWFWWSCYCGWSEGVMREFADRLQWDKDRRMRVFYADDEDVPFDPLWHEEYERWSRIFGDVLKELQGPHNKIQIVGPTAVGKTYAIKQLLKAYPGKLGIIRNTTTRSYRDEDDKAFYNLVDKEQFLDQKDQLDFAESDEYLGNYYGSSLAEARRVLKNRHGICAMTPKGAMAWYKECRFDFNLAVLLLTAPPAVLKKNLERRGVLDPKEQEVYIQKASRFALPSSMPHLKLEMTGTPIDKERILDLVSPLLK